jgi:hypothetical protein
MAYDMKGLNANPWWMSSDGWKKAGDLYNTGKEIWHTGSALYAGFKAIAPLVSLL